MTASAGDFVTPGTPVEIPDGTEAGNGLTESREGFVAVVHGRLVMGDGGISVDSSRPPINSPEVGDIVIGEVNRLNENVAEIRILHVESREGGHRSLPAMKLFADIHVSEVVDRFTPSPGDAMRMRDIVRAKIIKSDPILKASTKGNSKLGVLSALCTQCGEDLVASDEKVDFNVKCNNCDYSAYRVLSDGFGHGHEIRSKKSELNRSGERWSPEAEAGLGHDGARPYLSPLADFRRGANHEMPASAKATRGGRGGGRGGRGGGRGGQGGPRREMHKAVCTLCGCDTQVPFEPTPGKPIRCRDCMDKVKDGRASKEELTKERETMNEMRAKAQATMGTKLFVGRLSYDTTEDELVEAFSALGKVKSVQVAMDRDSGRSKGFAFVTFSNREEGLAAAKKMNGAEMGGRKIVVEESKPSGGGRKGGERRGRGDRNRSKR
jgi:CxxC-x17-CxxC domain-containing protein